MLQRIPLHHDEDGSRVAGSPPRLLDPAHAQDRLAAAAVAITHLAPKLP